MLVLAEVRAVGEHLVHHGGGGRGVKGDVDEAGRATIYLRNVEDFADVDAVYAKAFTATVKPARVAFGNNMIPKGALVEIDVIAVSPESE